MSMKQLFIIIEDNLFITKVRPKACPYTSGNTLWLSELFLLYTCLDIHPRGFHGLFFSLLVNNLAASCTLTLLFLITCVSLGLRQNLGMPLTHTHTHALTHLLYPAAQPIMNSLHFKLLCSCGWNKNPDVLIRGCFRAAEDFSASPFMLPPSLLCCHWPTYMCQYITHTHTHFLFFTSVSSNHTTYIPLLSPCLISAAMSIACALNVFITFFCFFLSSPLIALFCETLSEMTVLVFSAPLHLLLQ